MTNCRSASAAGWIRLTLLQSVVWLLPMPAQALFIDDGFEASSVLIFGSGPGEVQLRDPAFGAGEITASKVQRGAFDAAHAISAARATETDFAANAKIEARNFFTDPRTGYSKVESVAHYGAAIFNDSLATNFNLGMEFLIPPSFMELTLTNELPNLRMTSSIDALITLTTLPLPGTGAPPLISALLQIHAEVSGSFNSRPTFSSSLMQVPGVSLAGLAAPTITVTNNSGGTGCGAFDGQCTFLYDFGEIAGTINLGVLTPLESLAVNYFMTATVSGPATFTGAIAALNDPFFFSDDPLPPVPRPAFVELAPVPAPSTAILLGSALLVTSALRNATHYTCGRLRRPSKPGPHHHKIRGVAAPTRRTLQVNRVRIFYRPVSDPPVPDPALAVYQHLYYCQL